MKIYHYPAGIVGEWNYLESVSIEGDGFAYLLVFDRGHRELFVVTGPRLTADPNGRQIVHRDEITDTHAIPLINPEQEYAQVREDPLVFLMERVL